MTTRLFIVWVQVWCVSCVLLPVLGYGDVAQDRPKRTTVEAEQRPRVILQAEILDYFQAEGRLVAAGKAIVTYGKTRLFADRIEMHTDSGMGTAWGHVRLLTPEDDVKASRLDFNLTTERGLLYDAAGVVAQVYQVTGDRIAWQATATTTVQHGRLTTCTNAVPDWEFRAREAMIDPDDYVSLKHPSFWIKGIPVFYLPYFFFPIKDERTTGFLPPRLGYTSNDGASVREDFFWAISDWMDTTVGLEYLSKRGFLPHMEYRYAIDPLSDGRLEAAYIDDQKDDQTLWHILIQQRQEFGWGIRGLTQIDLRSEHDLLRSFSNDIRQESQVNTISYGSLTKHFPDSALTLGGASFDGIPDSGTTEQFRRLPTLRFRQFQTPLFGSAFFAVDASYNRLSNTQIIDNKPVQRLDFFPSVTLPLAWAPWMRLTVFGGVRETFYDRQITGSTPTTRELIDLRANLEGPILRRIYSGAQEGQTFVHVIESRVAYRYVPDVNQRDIPAFEALDATRHFLDPIETIPLVDRIQAANYAKFFLVNRLFIREPRGAARLRVREAARLTLSQGLDIREATEANGQLLGPLDVEIELNLWQRWHLVSMLRLDTATGDLEASSARMTFTVRPGWAVHLAHNYRQDPDVQYLTGGLSISPLDGLQLGYNFRYDGLTGTLREHRIALTLLAQCWSVDMTFRIRDTEETPFFSSTSFSIQFRLFNL
ncbi:MAG: LPS assembly protein LptD [Candidatus Tectomicrobia bacterium]